MKIAIVMLCGEVSYSERASGGGDVCRTFIARKSLWIQIALQPSRPVILGNIIVEFNTLLFNDVRFAPPTNTQSNPHLHTPILKAYEIAALPTRSITDLRRSIE
jgi:hypothetical protein